MIEKTNIIQFNSLAEVVLQKRCSETENFAKFTQKNMCRNLMKLPAFSLKRHTCFLMSFAKFLKTPF